MNVQLVACSEVRFIREYTETFFHFSFSLIRLTVRMTQQEQQRFANRLANEKSSYLQQHAHNPVNR